jgi:hypothetical protein
MESIDAQLQDIDLTPSKTLTVPANSGTETVGALMELNPNKNRMLKLHDTQNFTKL